MMHGEMWWMPLMMWAPLLLLLLLGIAVGYLWARGSGQATASLPSGGDLDAAPHRREAGQPSTPAGSPLRAEQVAGLDENEQTVYELVAHAETSSPTREAATILQKELPERTGLSKATVSRVLDRLEHRGLVHRVSHGMTNKLVLGDRARL